MLINLLTKGVINGAQIKISSGESKRKAINRAGASIVSDNCLKAILKRFSREGISRAEWRERSLCHVTSEKRSHQTPADARLIRTDNSSDTWKVSWSRYSARFNASSTKPPIYPRAKP